MSNMEYLDVLTIIQTIGPVIAAGLGTYLAYIKLSRERRSKEEVFKKNLAVFENSTSISLMAISGKIEKLEEKVDRQTQDISDQKASIARLEGKIEISYMKKD